MSVKVTLRGIPPLEAEAVKDAVGVTAPAVTVMLLLAELAPIAVTILSVTV